MFIGDVLCFATSQFLPDRPSKMYVVKVTKFITEATP